VRSVLGSCKFYADIRVWFMLRSVQRSLEYGLIFAHYFSAVHRIALHLASHYIVLPRITYTEGESSLIFSII
jgi:hypothetical protein